MSAFSSWLNAARLRTLPLSISGTVTGSGLAAFHNDFSLEIFILTIFTAIGFQVTSNLANDYGDGVKGTDNAARIGPARTLQSGKLSRKMLKQGILISLVSNLILVLILIWYAFGNDNMKYSLLFFVLGIMSAWAAIRYTMGSSAYGYKGWGDVFVFVFFGLLAVIGTAFLYAMKFYPASIYPAITIGFLSTGVLNLNNLRDYASDKDAGKNTLVVKMGFENGKKYHYLLLLSALIAMTVFIYAQASQPMHYLPFLGFIPIVAHGMRFYNENRPESLDPELKKLAISTFVLALLFFLGYSNFL